MNYGGGIFVRYGLCFSYKRRDFFSLCFVRQSRWAVSRGELGQIVLRKGVMFSFAFRIGSRENSAMCFAAEASFVARLR